MIHKNNVPAIAIIITMAVVTSMGFAAQYGGGSGTPEYPYQIWDANDLNEIGLHDEDWDKHFALMADIDMAGFSYTTAVIAYDAESTDHLFDGIPFTGALDGRGNCIWNMEINTKGASNDFLGLIGQTGSGALIEVKTAASCMEVTT